MTAVHAGTDREDSDVRFARALQLHGIRNANGWRDTGFRGLSQTTIASEIGLSRPMISSLAGRAGDMLTESGLLLDPNKAGCALGIDFGQGHHRVAIADIHGQLFRPADDRLYESPGDTDPAPISFAWATDRLRVLLDEAEVDAERIWAVGVSLPGPVNARTQRLQAAPGEMDRSWEVIDVQLPRDLRLPAPVVEADYNASAITEHLWGSMQDSQDALYVKVGRRCACSLLVEGRIYRGSDGLAGVLGRTVCDPDGNATREPIEKVFSLPALSADGDVQETAPELVDRAKTDSTLDESLRRGARALGFALAPIIDVLNPESVVIGGALGTASLAWIATDLIDGICSTGDSSARSTISERLEVGAFSRGTALRGAIASALLADAPARIAAAMG